MMKPHGDSGSEESEGSHFCLMTQSLLPFKILKIILNACYNLTWLNFHLKLFVRMLWRVNKSKKK